MNTRIFRFFLITGILFIISLSVYGQIPKAFQGTWKWNAPMSEPGFTDGSAVFTKDTIIMVYDAMDTKFRSYNLEVRKDSVFWFYDFMGIEVYCCARLDNNKSVKAYAVTALGKSEVILTRNDTKKTK